MLKLNCNVVKGALLIMFNKKRAVMQNICYCLKETCLSDWSTWTKIKVFSIDHLGFEENIDKRDKIIQITQNNLIGWWLKK